MGLRVDCGDLKLGIGLSVAHLALGILLGAVSEYSYLLALAILKSLSNYLSALNIGSANNSAVILANNENVVKLDNFICCYFELFDENYVALSNAILLSAGSEYCVHVTPAYLFSLAVFG